MAELPRLLKRLPAALDLEESARRTGALRRRRGVLDAMSLLRLALAYAACGLSLRGAAAWAEASALAQLSDVAVLNRLRKAAGWLGEIIGAILTARLGSAGAPGKRRWRLVDATSLSCPGSRRTDWRVHVSCRLGPRPRIDQLDLSDGRGSESLSRFTCGPGDIVIGDRGYAKASDLAAITACGADFIVRIGWNAVRLRGPDGRPFDLMAALKRVPAGGTADLAVTIACDRAGKKLLPARLIVRGLSASEAERNRQRARRKSRKQGKRVRPQTVRAAGYVLLLASLDAASFSAADVLALYRLRWQIELLFKRLKSLLHLDALPAKDPDLARSWIYAKLIVALLLEEMTDIFLDSPPWAGRSRADSAFPVARAALAA
jgi:hypothetical protein